ncbi:MAG: TRC40/GET3/ArsA family transport-energizing ATPase [Candidatus Binatia bacterium]
MHRYTEVALHNPALSPGEKAESLPSFLANENLKFILFGGKGGVGKTTSAAATAVYLADTNPTRNILIVSTDPAHSLSDSFDCSIGEDLAAAIAGLQNLHAMEMKSERVHAHFIEQHQFDLIELADKATFFGIAQLAKTFGMSYPTSFDFMVMLILVEFIKTDRYDLIIIDTAPTGHTLMFLQLLFELPRQIDAMEESQAKHRYMMTRYYGEYKKTRSDKFLDQLRQDVAYLKNILTGNRTEFVPVTIAEEMSIFETKRLISALRKRRFQIPTKNIIVNGLSPSIECHLCMARKREEETYVDEITRAFPGHNIIRIPLFQHEIRGEGLLAYAGCLTGKNGFHAMEERYAHARAYEDMARIDHGPGPMANILEKEALQCMIFGGKGGVGKTTSAAATAIHLARTRPHQKIFICSADPAHSLSDSLAYFIGDKTTAIEGFTNLYAREINPETRFAGFKSAYEAKIREAFKPEEHHREAMGIGIQSGTSRPYDESTLYNLVSVAPLGLDEVMALADTIERVRDEYDFIIIDTAPTGHLIKLMQRPEMVLEWFTHIIQGIQKYTGMMRSTVEVTTLLLQARKQILRTYKLFMDQQQTEFVAVSIAELMAVYETERLLTDLRDLKVSSSYVVINKIVPLTGCSFCGSKREEQVKYLEDIRKSFPSFAIAEIPLFPHQIRGIKDLTAVGQILYGP